MQSYLRQKLNIIVLIFSIQGFSNKIPILQQDLMNVQSLALID